MVDYVKLAEEKAKQPVTIRTSEGSASRLEKLKNDAKYFVGKYGKAEYNRALNYYTTKTYAEQYGIDTKTIAPTFSQYDDLVTNKDQYKQKYGDKEYKRIRDYYAGLSKDDISKINKAVSYKTDAKNFGSDLFEYSPKLAERYKYDDADAEDQLRKAIGLMPKSFSTSEAKAIIKAAKEIEKAKNITDADYMENAVSTGWDSLDVSDSSITREDLIKAINILNETSGVQGQRQIEQAARTAQVKAAVTDSMNRYSAASIPTIPQGKPTTPTATTRQAEQENYSSYSDEELTSEISSLEAALAYLKKAKKQDASTFDAQYGTSFESPEKDAAYSGLSDMDNRIQTISDTLTEMKDTRYYNRLTAKKTEYEEKATGESDFSEVVESGKKVISDYSAQTSPFTDGQKKIISFINNPGLKTLIGTVATATMGRGVTADVLAGVAPKYMTLTEDEANTLRYYYAKGDKKSFDGYLSTLDRELDKRYARQNAKNRTEALDKAGAMGKVAATAGAVAESFETPLAYVENMGQAIKNEITGEYEPTNQYSYAQQAASVKSELQNYVLKDASDFVKFLGNVGFSLADMSTKLPFGPAVSLAYMSASAAGQATNDALQRGATPEQAAAEGTIYGVIEYVTEKLPIDNLFRVKELAKEAAKSGVKMSLKEGVKNALKQAGIEATEELISEYADTLTDINVMGKKSEYELRISALEKQGMSRNDAEKQAQTEFFIYNPLVSAASGAVSGGLMGGGAAFVGGMNSKSTTPQQATTQTQESMPSTQTNAQLAPEKTFYSNQYGVTADTQFEQKALPAPGLRSVSAPIKTPKAEIATAQTEAQQPLSSVIDKTNIEIDNLNQKTLNDKIGNTKLKETVKNALGMKTPLDEKFISALSEMESTYQKTDNVTQKRVAKEFVDNNFEQAEKYIKENNTLQSNADAAIASEIIDRYRQSGRADEALEMIRQTAVKFSKAGQQVQSAALWSKMTPEGTVKAVESAISKFNKKLGKNNQYTLSEASGKFLMDTADKINTLDAQGLADLFIDLCQKRNRKIGKTVNTKLDALVKQNNIDLLKDITYQSMTLSVYDGIPRTLGQKASTIQAFSHLLNPRTILRNITSNTVFKYQEVLTDYPAAFFDFLMSLGTKQRTVAAPSLKIADIKRGHKASVDYAADANFEIQTGVRLNNELSKYELFKGETFTATNSKFLHKLEKMLGYSLRTPDQYAKGAVEINEIYKQLKLQGKDVEGKTIDQLLGMADNETLSIAKEQALYNTFQNDGFIPGLLQSAKKTLNIAGINKGDFGLGDLTIKYTKVPGNLIQRSIDYTPVGALKVLKYLGTKNLTRTQQRDIAKTLGRALVGSTTLIGVSYVLSKLGIIVSPPDNDDKERKFFEGTGLSGRKINISAIERILKGESAELQDGDRLVSFDYLETINVPISLGHELYKAIDNDVSIEKTAKNLLNTFTDEALDLPTMYIINKMVYEGMKDDSTAIDVFAVPFLEAIPGFIPSPIRQASTALDSTQRDTKTFTDRLLSNTPLRGELPERLGTFGQPVQKDSGILSFFNPGTSTTYSPFKFSKELKRLADTYSDYDVYPSGKPTKSISRDGVTYTLTEEEQQKFMKQYGEMLSDFYNLALSAKISDEEKIKKLKDAQTYFREALKDNYVFNLNKSKGTSNIPAMPKIK